MSQVGKIIGDTIKAMSMKFTPKEKERIKSLIYSEYKEGLTFKEIGKNKVEIFCCQDIETKLDITKIDRDSYSAFICQPDGYKYSKTYVGLNYLMLMVSSWILTVKQEYTTINRKKNITEFSENFYSIYEDGIFLEKMGSTNAGMLYRKAIEYIVIDYLNFFDKEDEIKNIKNTKSIIKVLKEMSFSDAVVNFINNNIDLGNNFSHYREKVNIENLSKMRENIGLIIEDFDKSFEYNNHFKEKDDLYIEKNKEMRRVKEDGENKNSQT